MRRSGAGCAPCPIAQLNVAILSASFSELMSAPLRAQATALAAQMAAEDGVGSALNHFLSSLPRHDLPCNPSSRRMPPHLHAPKPPPHAVRHDLLCDASLLLNPPEHKLALYRLRRRHAQLALQLVFGVATGLGIVAGSQCTNKTGLDGALGLSSLQPHAPRGCSPAHPGCNSSATRLQPHAPSLQLLCTQACSASRATSSTPRTGSIVRRATGSAPSSAAGGPFCLQPCAMEAATLCKGGHSPM